MKHPNCQVCGITPIIPVVLTLVSGGEIILCDNDAEEKLKSPHVERTNRYRIEQVPSFVEAGA